jgi:hypothetical protein
VSATDVLSEATMLGIAVMTLRRARKALGVLVHPPGRTILDVGPVAAVTERLDRLLKRADP